VSDAELLLLADPSPSLRYRVLTELLDVPADDPEAADLAGRRGAELAAALGVDDNDDGSPDAAGADGADLRSLTWALCRAAYLGFDRTEPGVASLSEALFARQSRDGAFPLAGFRRGTEDRRYTMMPLQTALPLRGLAAAGYAADPRAERAYDWLLAQRLDDGAWPVGVAAGQPGYIAGYRRLPGSTGCRVTTEAAIAALVLHPERRRSPDARRALDLLLQRETRDEWALGSEVERLVGTGAVPGFVTAYARFDLGFVLELATRAGAGPDDPRVASIAAFLDGRRGPAGVWEHPSRPELSRWLTFDLMLSERRLASGDWAGTAPSLPFNGTSRRSGG
jgi:hypothetical protein